MSESSEKGDDNDQLHRKTIVWKKIKKIGTAYLRKEMNN